jgi:hypothetical protein
VKVWVAGIRVSVDPTLAIGKGGEADVYDLGDGRALKLFKAPDHPDLAGDRVAQEAARQRLVEHQTKLGAFPAGLPGRVVRPEELATDRGRRRVVGYTMRLLGGARALGWYAEAASRAVGEGGAAVAAVFRDLHATLGAVHAAGVVVGDLNDQNVLVVGRAAHLIDADSFQFGEFVCRAYTERFVDPLRCDPAAGRPVLRLPHNADSDWYAYSVMLLRSFLQVDPYGGVHKPQHGAARISPAMRPLRRVTIFHPEVRYPKPALPPEILPDELLHHLHLVFERDRRGAFPAELLEGLAFKRCEACGLEHARDACPKCRVAAPAAVRESVVYARVRATRVLRSRSAILWAASEDGTLRLALHERDAIRREDGTAVIGGPLDPSLHARVSGERTLLARGGALVLLAPRRPPERHTVESVGGIPCFDANARHAYWIEDGRLWRDGHLGPERIGDVLRSQTRFWVGPTFGFGFYWAGELFAPFVFEAVGRAIRDGIPVPRPSGRLVEVTATLSHEACFFFTAAREAGRTVHRCTLIGRDGSLRARAEADADDDSWLGHVHGACAVGNGLFVPTDDGIVRVEADGGRLVVTRDFPESEPFVDGSSRLLPGRGGLYVVGRGAVSLLQLEG